MPRTPLARTSFLALLTLLSLLVGALSLRYALPRTPFAMDLDNLGAYPGLFTVHAVAASIALMLGPFQFMAGLRRRWPALHRALGRLCAAAIAAGFVSALPMAVRAQTGALASAGFLVLALLWCGATARGVQLARERRFAAHRAWMLRSFALTCAAITLRIYLGSAIALGIPFEVSYPAIAWLCWVPNALAAEAWLAWERRRARPYGAALAAASQRLT